MKEKYLIISFNCIEKRPLLFFSISDVESESEIHLVRSPLASEIYREKTVWNYPKMHTKHGSTDFETYCIRNILYT